MRSPLPLPASRPFSDTACLLRTTTAQALDELPTAARELVLGLLHPEPTARLGAQAAGGARALQERPFFTEAEPPIDFESIFTLPPPPLVPPPPMPSIEGDSVLNSQLAARQPLSLADRKALALVQASVRWSAFLEPARQELIVLATTVVKRKGIFSAKRRQLILTDGLDENGMPCCRICYVDPGEPRTRVRASLPHPAALYACG